MKLSNKVAIVTGGTSGIGKATVILFAKEGAKVVFTGRSSERGKATVETVLNENGEAEFIKGDVSCSFDCKAVVDKTIQKYRKIDILFNNAGIEVIKPLVDTEEREWDTLINTNLKGVFLMSKYVIPHMIRERGGSIISTSSIFGIVGCENWTAYCASKGGVTLLTKAMAHELAKYNIRVNCVAPGTIVTPMFYRELKILSKFRGISEDELKEQYLRSQIVPRFASPEDVAEAVLYLASDSSSFVTGIVMPIDGGYTAI